MNDVKKMARAALAGIGTGAALLFCFELLFAQTSQMEAPAASTATVSSSTGTARRPPFIWRSVENKAFGVGENIRYVVKYGFVHAGFATLEVKALEDLDRGRVAFYILSQAKTNKTMDLMFKVRDKNESWMDAQALCSHQFNQDIREGFYAKQTQTTFDQPAGRFHYVKTRKGKSRDEKEGEIPPFVQDVLSSLYYVRTQPLEVGMEIDLEANSGGKSWPLVVRVLKKEKISVPSGKFECFKIEPVMAGEGIFNNEGKLEIWMTADEHKIPVLLRSRVAVGAFDAEMMEYQSGNIAAPAGPAAAPGPATGG